MTDEVKRARPLTFSSRVLMVLALVFLAAKLALVFVVNPFMDETYYWMWGQHPALSYFDHPPLVAWTEGLSAALFGWNNFALRAPALLTIFGDIGLLYLFAKRQGGESWRELFWAGVLVFAATPAFLVTTSVALPDHLMVFLLIAALYCFSEMLRANDEGRAIHPMLYLGAVALALALLSKYYAILFALALVVYLLATRYRKLFLNPHLWLAMALVVALQTPVLVWNFQHDFVSFRFITGGRQAISAPLSFSGTIGYLLGVVLMLSPFLLWPVFRFAFARRDGTGLARVAFWVSTIAFLAASIFTNILIHWNVIAYTAALPFLLTFLRSRILLVGHMLFGVLIVAFVLFNYNIVPVLALFNPNGDRTSAWSHGWSEVAAAVEAAKQGREVGFIAGTSYETASPLGFALGDPEVTSLAARTDAYDFWFDAEAHRGQSALIVADRWQWLTSSIRERFATVEQVGTVSIVREGRPVDDYGIYYATGYTPPEH